MKLKSINLPDNDVIYLDLFQNEQNSDDLDLCVVDKNGDWLYDLLTLKSDDGEIVLKKLPEKTKFKTDSEGFLRVSV